MLFRSSSLARHVNAAPRKSLEIQAVYQKTKNSLGEKICVNSSFKLLSYILKLNLKKNQKFCNFNFSDVM